MQVSVSPEVNALLDSAATLSARRGLAYVGVEHLFEALANESKLLPEALNDRYFQVFPIVIRELAQHAWQGVLPVSGRDVFHTPRCAAALNEAARLAQRLGHGKPSAGHVLLALLADAHAQPSRIMDRLQLDRGGFIQALRQALAAGALPKGEPGQRQAGAGPDDQTGSATSQERPAGVSAPAQTAEPRQGAGGAKSPLEELTRDLSLAARQGRIEPAIGRDKEMYQILEVLNRRSKNNAILVGEAGVGKTKIVEGMAVLGAKQRESGGVLAQWRFLELNIAALMAGTQYRGALEEKVAGLLEILKHTKDTILFIDEIHLIMGAGAVGEGGMDLANLLKPALARGEIRCIGATTLDEYRKFVERDPALERRFQMARIEPLSPGATWDVLNRLRPGLEKHHNIRISRKALHAAITLTGRYMPNRHHPDKAIDVVDQACARYRLLAVATKARPELFEHGSQAAGVGKVTPHDIRKVVSQMAGVPIEEITAEERNRLEGLEQKFRDVIIGQDHAVSKVVAAAKKSRAGLADPNRPDAVMLFLGPTGVGKTQMAKTLADLVFGSPAHLTVFDMSEYGEPHTVSRLIGAPPGYQGHDEEGLLTAAVRARPFSVLLFDEIEKAHRKVFDVFLPLLDEGRIKDNMGRDVNFRNCMILFTSNIGADVLREEGTETDLQRLMDALHRRFRPEFINRIDEIVPFYPLLFEDIRTILAHLIEDLSGRLKAKGIQFHVYQGAYEHLAERGYNPEYGARELRRTVERLVINPLSALLVEGQFGEGDCVEVLMEEEALTFRKRAPAAIGGEAAS